MRYRQRQIEDTNNGGYANGGTRLVERDADMPRDDDLMRSLLIQIEESEGDHQIINKKLSRTEEEKKELYHLKLLRDQGFVKFEGDTFRLTNSGHDFVQAIKDDTVWRKTKNAIAETGGSATIEIIKAVAVAYLKDQISKHTGLKL